MTEPLLPPDVDLRGMPFMPLEVVRLLDSDLFAISTGEEFKAAVALWGRSWHQVPAASLPDDDRILAHLTGTGARWKKVKEVALRGWVMCTDGRWYHPVVAEKAAEAWKYRLGQRDRAAKRWLNHGEASRHAAAHATASATGLQETVKGQLSKDSKTTTSAAFVLPDWIPVQSWVGWIEVRAKNKAPNTTHALNLAVAKLVMLKAKGFEPGAVLDEACLKGWKGLFEPTSSFSRPGAHAVQASPQAGTIECEVCKKRVRTYAGRRCDPCTRLEAAAARPYRSIGTALGALTNRPEDAAESKLAAEEPRNAL